MTEPLVQFVCFRTALDERAFLPAWMTFASSFLARGLETIVLSKSLEPGAEFGFISRNAWDEGAFAATFPAGLPGEAGGFGISAVQGGAFRRVTGQNADLHRARPGQVKVMALMELEAAATADFTGLASAVSGRAEVIGGWALYASASPRWKGRFSAVLELFVEPAQAGTALTFAHDLVQTLPSRRAAEIAQYQETLVLPRRD